MNGLPHSNALAGAVTQAQQRLLVRSATEYSQKADAWQSASLGMGTSEDRIQSLRYDGFVNRLTDPILEGMFMTEIYAYAGVTIFPDTAFSEGIKYQGTSDHDAACDYLDEQMRVPEICNDGAVWGRLYGGCVTWIVTDRDLGELEAPIDPGEEILALRNIERPFVTPILDPDTFDAAGRPQWYMLTPPQGRIHTTVHISRIVLWPGDRTPQRRRIQIGHWDFSALQRPFDVLKRNGMVSTAAMQLLAEASIGILSVKDLWQSLSAGTSTAIATRMRQFNAARANARAILLDKDREAFDRVNTTFAGVSDLTDRARLEVAAAFRVPVTRLMGQAPAGLNGSAGADSNERNFQKDVSAYQRHSLEAPVKKLVQTLLNADQSPVSAEGLSIMWPDLWAPTEAERAQMYSQIATADGAYLDREVLSPSQVRERFKPEGFQVELDMDATQDTNGDGDIDLNDDPANLVGTSEGGNTPDVPGAAKPVANVPAPSKAPNPGALEPQAMAPGVPIKAGLESQHVNVITDLISQVAKKTIPRDAAQNLLTIVYGMQPQHADALLASAGKDFEPPAPPPAAAPPSKNVPPAAQRSGKPEQPNPLTGEARGDGERADHIDREGDDYVVYNEARTRKFGSYKTREEAEKRLGELEAHKD